MHKTVAVFGFSSRGVQTGTQIIEVVRRGGAEVEAYAPARLKADGWKDLFSLSEVLEKRMLYMDALVFVGAAGIAVRGIAPFVKSKLSDPAVLVVDEQGQYVIPILSGHVGGANAFARTLAREIGAFPVITTATDGTDVFSVDTYARQQHMAIVEKDEIKHLSGALLAGEPIGALTPECGFLITPDPVSTPFSHTLHLVPQDLVVGIGCRRGVSAEQLYQWVSDRFCEKHWSLYRIRAIASIDVKREEEGLCLLAKRLQVPFLTYPAEELLKQQGDFQGSGFVKDTVGVENVCERSALCAAVREGWLPENSRFENFCLLPKLKGEGMTLAVLTLSR